VKEEGGGRRRRRRRRSPGYRIKNKNPTQRCGEQNTIAEKAYCGLQSTFESSSFKYCVLSMSSFSSKRCISSAGWRGTLKSFAGEPRLWDRRTVGFVFKVFSHHSESF